jgi:hypothetical protein
MIDTSAKTRLDNLLNKQIWKLIPLKLLIS